MFTGTILHMVLLHPVLVIVAVVRRSGDSSGDGGGGVRTTGLTCHRRRAVRVMLLDRSSQTGRIGERARPEPDTTKRTPRITAGSMGSRSGILW